MREKNIVVWLMGGFGNVLFQLVAIEKLKENYDKKNIKICTDLTKRNIHTKILNWVIHKPIYNNLITNYSEKKYSFFSKNIILFNVLLSKIFKTSFYKTSFITSANSSFENLENIFGYFQFKEFLNDNKKYINIVSNNLRNLYYKPEKKYIAIHYRMTDSSWPKKNLNYYSEVKKKLMNKKEYKLIVTDNLKSAKMFFEGIENYKVISSEDPLYDFSILVSAKELYCAPSTFSWWASHSVSDNTKVTIPKFIFNKLGYHKLNLNNNLSVI